MKRTLAELVCLEIVICASSALLGQVPYSSWSNTDNDPTIQYRWQVSERTTYSGAPGTHCSAQFRDLKIKDRTSVSYRYDLVSSGKDYSNSGESQMSGSAYGIEL